MKKYSKILFLSTLMLLILPIVSSAEFEAGIKIDEDGVSDFYFAISKHFSVPKEEVIVVQKKSIPDDELPVVFFLAKHLGIKHQTIIKLRLNGDSWHDICKFYGLSPEIFYVELSQKPAPPYGKAWGHFKNKPKRNWREIYLSDDDVVNLVNLKFASEYYHCEPEYIIQMRSDGANFNQIHHSVKERKNADKKNVASAKNDKSSKKKNGNGNSKGKSKKK